jgi:hypothetical protein
MTISDPTVDGASIVLLGSFNPKIFQPMWLLSEGLISRSEAENANIQVIQPEAAFLEVGPFQLRVLGDRFVAATSQIPNFSPLRDLVVGIFRLLRHTPARALGINREMHYRADDRLSWEGVQKRLGASVPWSAALPGAHSVGIDLRGSRENTLQGYVGVRLEPSRREEAGAFIRINDHYDVASEPTQAGLATITGIIETEFTASMERSLHTARALLEVLCLREP